MYPTSQRYRTDRAHSPNILLSSNILEKNYYNLNPDEQLVYVKTMAEYFFTVKFIPLEPDVKIQLNKTKNLIKSANDHLDIELALHHLSQYFLNWKPEYFIQGGSKAELQKRSRELAELVIKIHNISYYAKLHILTHREAYPFQATSAETWQSYPNGLPPSLIKSLLAKPEVGIIKVNGGNFNAWGHSILIFGNDIFHVDREIYGHPKHLTLQQFKTYLVVNDKELEGIHHVMLGSTNSAIIKLDELLRSKWKWLGPVENCLTFCRAVVKAGGYTIGSAEEYGKFRADLPRQYQKNVPHQETIKSELPSLEERRFSHEKLKTVLITNINVIESYRPEEIIKFLFFVYDNYQQVFAWQREVSKGPSDNDIRIMIDTKLKSIMEAIVGKYSILFHEEIIGTGLKIMLNSLSEDFNFLPPTSISPRFVKTS